MSNDIIIDKTNAGFLGRNSTAILRARFLDYLVAMRENKNGFGKKLEKTKKMSPTPAF
jgi:hypothetical protein